RSFTTCKQPLHTLVYKVSRPHCRCRRVSHQATPPHLLLCLQRPISERNAVTLHCGLGSHRVYYVFNAFEARLRLRRRSTVRTPVRCSKHVKQKKLDGNRHTCRRVRLSRSITTFIIAGAGRRGPAVRSNVKCVNDRDVVRITKPRVIKVRCCLQARNPIQSSILRSEQRSDKTERAMRLVFIASDEPACCRRKVVLLAKEAVQVGKMPNKSTGYRIKVYGTLPAVARSLSSSTALFSQGTHSCEKSTKSRRCDAAKAGDLVYTRKSLPYSKRGAATCSCTNPTLAQTHQLSASLRTASTPLSDTAGSSDTRAWYNRVLNRMDANAAVRFAVRKTTHSACASALPRGSKRAGCAHYGKDMGKNEGDLIAPAAPSRRL
uniref:NTR domain-containing protein n=1 Tax=Macrostomum lignano TaxID=282301 RepID=A0A1I8FFT3_9PLAT